MIICMCSSFRHPTHTSCIKERCITIKVSLGVRAIELLKETSCTSETSHVCGTGISFGCH